MDELNYQYIKNKLPKGWSYPLKRSQIDQLLQENLVKEKLGGLHLTLGDWRGLLEKGGGTIIGASYCERPQSSNGSLIGLYLWLHPVQSTKRKTVEELLLQEGLPRLGNWLRFVEQQGEVWRQSWHHFYIQYHNSQLQYR